MNPIDPFLLALIQNPAVQRIQPMLKDMDFLDEVIKRLAVNTGQSFIRIHQVLSKSAGLALNDRNISLTNDWGVKVDGLKQSFIATPTNIKARGEYLCIANNTLLTSSAYITDTNFNLLGPLGSHSLTPMLSSGQYQSISDITVSYGNVLGERFYIASPNDNCIQAYDRTTFSFVKTIGPDLLTISAGALSSPVSIGIGVNSPKLYVLNSTGIPGGATGAGYLSVYKGVLNTFDSIPLFCGKNGGTGLCVQGEVKNPKDLFVLSGNGKDGKDELFILNGVADEIGKFDSDTYALKEVYRMPNELAGISLGLKRITVVNGVLYVTAESIGKVIAIDIKTKAYLGSFGELRSESVGESKGTLGYFNGLSGITSVGDKLLVTETLNNRVQSFSTSILADNDFQVTFQAYQLPINKRLVDITYSLSGDLEPDICLVDPSSGQEYEIKTALAIGLTHFCIRLKIKSEAFSNFKRSYELYPVYILLETYNG